ncbi:MAG: hypothetical protein ACHQAY_06745 [Hyphomicrobiales bacterium]
MGDEQSVVYRKYKGKHGKEAFEKYTLDEIDAIEAVAKHPEEYSFEPWPQSKPEQIVDHTPPVLEIKPELLPDQAMAAIQAAIAGPPGVPEGFSIDAFLKRSS